MASLRSTLAATAILLLQTPLDATFAASNNVTGRTSATLLRSTNQFWTEEIASLRGRYRIPKLASFGTQIDHVCGLRFALTGPFYCPVNETVYLDQAFLRQLTDLAGDDANAALGYVIAHEAAHHVQNLLGTTSLVDQSRARSAPEIASRTLTTLELQADCYAGLWLRWATMNGTIKTPANVSTVLDAVSAVSRERQAGATAQRQMLDPLTHGTAAQRLKWLQRGMDSGQFNDCDTFGAESAGKL